MTKRILPLLFSFAFMVSAAMTLTVFAENAQNQDGLTAVLASEKTEYAANEDIDVSLSVKNTNGYAVNGIETKINLPEGLTLKTGELQQDAFALASDASKNNDVTLIKIAEATPYESPKTGNDLRLPLWGGLMIVSGTAVFLLERKKKGKGLFTLFLCLAMIASAMPTSIHAEDNEKSFTVSEDLTIDGQNVAVTADVTYQFVGHYAAKVNGGTGSAVYAVGDTVSIAASPVKGSHFAYWTIVSGDVSLANIEAEATTFIMPAGAVELKPNYKLNTYTITASSGSNGAVSPAGEITAKYGDQKTYTIAPAAGYQISDVTVDGKSVGTPSSYTFDDVSADHTINATFTIQQFTVTASAGLNGTISSTGNTEVDYGGSKTYNIAADDSCTIADVKVDGVSQGAISSYTFSNVSSAHTIEATFAKNKYTVTVYFGTVNGVEMVGNVSSADVAWGETVSIQVKDYKSWDFTRWFVDDNIVPLENEYAKSTTFIMPKGNVRIFGYQDS